MTTMNSSFDGLKGDGYVTPRARFYLLRILWAGSDDCIRRRRESPRGGKRLQALYRSGCGEHGPMGVEARILRRRSRAS